MMKKQTLHQMKNRKGFSINEVMISMFVMSVGIVTVIGLFSKGFINSQLDRDRIVAAGLAQEGVELVKNVRDNSFARGSSDNFEYFSISNKYCRGKL
jgi:Tfp pilus assembly protein PilV